MTRFELEILTVGALRKLARQNDLFKVTYSGVEISNMGKAMLVQELAKCHNEDTDPVVEPEPDPVEDTEPVTTEASKTDPAETLAQIQSIIGKPGADMAEVEKLIDSKTEGFASTSHVYDLCQALSRDLKEKLEDIQVPRRVEIVIPDMPVVDAGIQHECFPRLVQLAQLRMNILLVGPAGSGKTFAAEELAKSLKLNYEALSVGPMTMPSALFGYDDSKGVYHETGLVRCYRDGGVMLLDEIDAGNAGILTGINMATSNGVMSTPAGMIKKHKDFILIAGANTFGTGASAEYVGRNPLCKSTMDRFKSLEWNYDQSFEMHLAGPESVEEKDYVALVQKMRATAEELGIKVIISPRASIDGVKMLRAGIPAEDCLQLSVFAGLDSATISKLRG